MPNEENSEEIDENLSGARLTEDNVLALLKRTNLPPDCFIEISQASSLLNSRKVRLALVQNPRTPRHILLPLMRHLFTFDLMRVALMPAISADVKVAAEESLILRLEKLSLGEKVALARRASGRVAAALLRHAEGRVVETALENPRLTEAHLLKDLSRGAENSELIAKVCAHPKWSLRTDIKIALLRNETTPDHIAIDIVRSLPAGISDEVIRESDLPDETKRRLYNTIGKNG